MLTRPLGASFADWIAVPPGRGGLDLGTGPITLVLLVAIAAGVTALSVRRRQPVLTPGPRRAVTASGGERRGPRRSGSRHEHRPRDEMGEERADLQDRQHDQPRPAARSGGLPVNQPMATSRSGRDAHPRDRSGDAQK